MGKTRGTGNLIDNTSGTNTGDQSLSGYQPTSAAAYVMRANNTNATANVADQVFKHLAEQTYTGQTTWTGTTAPSGSTNHTYRGCRIGDFVFIRINTLWAVAGASLTILTLDVPTDWGTPQAPAGYTGASQTFLNSVGGLSTALGNLPVATRAAMKTTTVVLVAASGNYITGYVTLIFLV